MPRNEDGHTVETPVEARGGYLDRPVAAVLIASTVGIIGAFVVVYFAFFGS